jgi:predicted ATPase
LALSQGLIVDGRSGEALDLLNATIDQCERNGERLYMSELLRIKAAALGSIEGADDLEAERLLLEAATWARGQGARAWELRVAIDLARLRIAQGRDAEALADLEPALEGLSEGRNTADYRAARKMLEHLTALAR